MSRRDTTIAAIRFGLGPVPGELARIGTDPRGWLVSQLETFPLLPGAIEAAVPDASAALALTLDAQRNRPPPGAPNPIELSYRASMAALTRLWGTTEAPLVEHLALVWSNHLTVSRRGGNTAAMVADYHLRAARRHGAWAERRGARSGVQRSGDDLRPASRACKLTATVC